MSPPPADPAPAYPLPADPWRVGWGAGAGARAWRHGDDVLRRRASAVRDDPTLPYHLRHVWDGRPLAGRHVLVRCYHGLGDVLMCVRFLPDLVCHAASVVVEAPEALVALLRTIEGIGEVVGFDQARPRPPSEADIEIMELCHALRLRPDAVRSRAPNVTPAPLEPGTIGFCWRAGEWNPARSVPIEALAPVLRRAGRALLSLQHGPALDAGRVLAPDLFQGPGRREDDVSRTASLVAGVSLLVSVDTMVAHLGLLLGTPTIVLLRCDADWRWGREDGASPWYPGARCLRQDVEGDWAAPLARLEDMLTRGG